MSSQTQKPRGSGWYVGLMSGTSLDGVDGVLAEFSESKCTVAQYSSRLLAPDLRAELLALNRSGSDELHRAALAGNALARTYADVVHYLLAQAGLPATAVHAIGAHGQTVRHRPGAFDGTGYTLQLGNPALLAECTGITVVADFRSRDVAAGGQGAPLVPAFHHGIFGQAGRTVAVLNLGGISNLSILRPDNTCGNTPHGSVQGFDCGPANALMDYWCERHTGQPYDDNGAWARGGQAIDGLLQHMLAEPFLALAPPKSTGRDLFNPDWLAAHLDAAGIAPRTPSDWQNVQATLCEFTARTCAQELVRHAPGADLLIVCGGGALNGYLLERLQALLPGVRVESSQQHGLPPLQVEAAAFAWLARQCMTGATASLPRVTGARGARILGAIYPA